MRPASEIVKNGNSFPTKLSLKPYLAIFFQTVEDELYKTFFNKKLVTIARMRCWADGVTPTRTPLLKPLFKKSPRLLPLFLF
jgi:hypothetical protein